MKIIDLMINHPLNVTIVLASVVTKSPASECKYRKAKGPKGACDAATNTRTVSRQLKKNSPASCEPTKTFTEACRPTKPKQGEITGYEMLCSFDSFLS